MCSSCSALGLTATRTSTPIDARGATWARVHAGASQRSILEREWPAHHWRDPGCVLWAAGCHACCHPYCVTETGHSGSARLASRKRGGVPATTAYRQGRALRQPQHRRAPCGACHIPPYVQHLHTPFGNTRHKRAARKCPRKGTPLCSGGQQTRQQSLWGGAPASAASAQTRRSRVRAYSSVSTSKHSRDTPHARHTRGSSSSGWPRSTSSREPRACRLLCRSAQARASSAPLLPPWVTGDTSSVQSSVQAACTTAQKKKDWSRVPSAGLRAASSCACSGQAALAGSGAPHRKHQW